MQVLKLEVLFFQMMPLKNASSENVATENWQYIVNATFLKIKNTINKFLLHNACRGGVEDLTFEAKAKDPPKKIPGKDRLFEDRRSRGQDQKWSRLNTKDNFQTQFFVNLITIGKFSDFLNLKELKIACC